MLIDVREKVATLKTGKARLEKELALGLDVLSQLKVQTQKDASFASKRDELDKSMTLLTSHLQDVLCFLGQ